jgi:hypothetical protein
LGAVVIVNVVPTNEPVEIMGALSFPGMRNVRQQPYGDVLDFCSKVLIEEFDQ